MSENHNGGKRRAKNQEGQRNSSSGRTANQPTTTTSSSTKGSKNRAESGRNNNNRRSNSHVSIKNNGCIRRPNGNNSQNRSRSGRDKSITYPAHKSVEECLRQYTSQHIEYTKGSSSNDYNSSNNNVLKLPKLVRGKLRVLPGNNDNIPAFVSCDRGHYTRDVLIADSLARNRAMDGDLVFVQIDGLVERDDGQNNKKGNQGKSAILDEEAGDTIIVHDDEALQEDMEDLALEKKHRGSREPGTWQDDRMQMSLWNPQVSIPRSDPLQRSSLKNENIPQYQGRVICIVPDRQFGSELDGDGTGTASTVGASGSGSVRQRRIVGSLKILPSGTTLLTPLNKALPQFLCPSEFSKTINQQISAGTRNNNNDDEDVREETGWKEVVEQALYQAIYTRGDWLETHKWPPCHSVEKLGESCLVEDEIRALLMENRVDHGDHPPEVLRDVDHSVKDGLYQREDGDMGWKPTPNMYKGRRDYRQQRIFTIDPTTAKDLDDALHVTLLPDLNQVEIGVHIADVSFFCRPHTPVDQEAQRRATTVYLVDRTIPMLPRALCEIACSLNENTERLAFSCVWRMNLDGTLPKTKDGNDDIWYGRTVIKSCARLDYATAQNIIDGKVGNDCDNDGVDEALWPTSRRPSGGHTMTQVAADVILLHKVAMERRKLRFDNGALALNGIKLTFQLDKDGQTPLLAAPYPIRDSNRLVEEYMLLANYLVAQRLITHSKSRALLRHHSEPLEDGLDKVADVAMAAIGFEIDIRTSQTLHESLCRLKQECTDPLVMMSVTQMLMAPMQPADYFAAGTLSPEQWKHFALNIPYYTHFTSPIRRYPDVIVHRLLQATLDESIDKFELSVQDINMICNHCNEMRMASKKAQERCDRVFLALFVRAHPLSGEMGVVLSVGLSSFTVFCPSVGVSTLLYLEEHKDMLTFQNRELAGKEAAIGTDSTPTGPVIDLVNQKHGDKSWTSLEIRIFAKIKVTLYCRDKPPIDVKLRLEGPWD
ncbi:hypothetical protein ACA910_008512 [Epithemia clementina (nom. ined.)]